MISLLIRLYIRNTILPLCDVYCVMCIFKCVCVFACSKVHYSMCVLECERQCAALRHAWSSKWPSLFSFRCKIIIALFVQRLCACSSHSTHTHTNIIYWTSVLLLVHSFAVGSALNNDNSDSESGRGHCRRPEARAPEARRKISDRPEWRVNEWTSEYNCV